MAARSFAKLPGFEIVSRLGRGAHATISLGIERSSNQKFAIKHIVRRNAEDDRFIEQAEAEFDIARRFEHPTLRRCHDIVRVRKWLRVQELFLIMEYVDGETLERRCPSRISAILSIFRRVAEGLHALHMLGYAHADLKPNNILLTADGGIKIIDFGQSCRLGHRKERVQGTPDYIAPEQVRREPIDQRTDVFNLGATMYWILTGKAFKTMLPIAKAGDRVIEIESRRGNEPPHEVDPRVPLPVSRLVMECCDNNRDERPRDMRVIASRIETIQQLLAKRGKDSTEVPQRGGR